MGINSGSSYLYAACVLTLAVSSYRSGTVGAAMSAAIAGTPAIALSWGLMTGYKPPAQDLIDGALTASCKVISKLWELGFPESYLLYTVNIPVSCPSWPPPPTRSAELPLCLCLAPRRADTLRVY